MAGEYLVFELKARTLTPAVSGETKIDRQEKTKTKLARITGDGRVAIPIYGVLRGYLEIMLRQKGENVCDTGKKGAIPCARCVLCDLFGSLEKKGRAIIDDLVSVEPYKNIVHPTIHLRINRETGTVSDTLKIEEIQEGAVFTGKIRVLFPKERDVELIMAGLKAIEEFGLGGWVTRGRGRIKFTKIEIKKKSWVDFLNEARKELQNLGINL